MAGSQSSIVISKKVRRRSFMAQPFKHPSSGVFYLRRKVPAELKDALGREYKRSLKTTDPREAKRLFALEWARSEDVFALARARASGAFRMSYRDMKIFADRWLQSELSAVESTGDFTPWLAEGPTSSWQRGDEGGEYTPLVPIGQVLEHEHDIAWLQQQFIMPLLKKVLAQYRLPPPPPTSQEAAQLLSVFQEAWLKLSDIANRRANGDWSPVNNLASETASVEIAPTQNAEGKTLMQVFEEYAQERLLNDGDGRAVRKSLDAYRVFMSEFIEICGDLPLSRVTRETIRQYRVEVARLPSRGEGIRLLSVAQKIAKADAESLPRVTEATVRNKLRAVSSVFSYAVRMQLLSENPVIASGQGKAAAKAAARRFEASRDRNSYTSEELTRIFQSPVFRGEWQSVRPSYGQAWYWLPLLMYYTGARREELSQLKVSDLIEDSGPVPHLSILNREGDEDSGRSVKTSASRRNIPLHPHLIELGFLAYVRSQNPNGAMFPSLVPDSKGYYGTGFGKHWGRYLREIVGLTTPVRPAHGFRHTFKTLCRAVGIPEDVHDAITGHTGVSRVARGYGAMPLERIAIELERFPRLSLPSCSVAREFRPI